MDSFPITIEQYHEHERANGCRYEFVNGYIYAMVGGSRRHNLLTVTLARLLGNHLEGSSCQVYASDMKVKAGSPSDNIFFYPDVMVACGRGKQDQYVEHEPRLIVEVLSPGTEQHDRLGKLEAYTQIASLHEYVLVDQSTSKIDTYRRAGCQWRLFRYREGDYVQFESIDFEVAVERIYRSVIGIV
ncbi:Uma2 family endonuclease [Sansalvadorimonas verongulae]|uniref:Uma2 family endonuclease n=1 Tax=Sansalvadorimonas verongulae TaxID=2172824 RepID=UPI0018AD216B|nr:Uma2 family endonuclease [Sansalvadorimonas verongulae]